MFHRSYLIPVLLTMNLVLCVLFVSCDNQTAVLDGDTAVLEYRDNDLLYTFHLPTGTEALFDVKNDPDCLINILSRNRECGANVRKHLEKKLHVQSLEELRDENSPVLRSLKGLGYI